jgi:hypothetical protein
MLPGDCLFNISPGGTDVICVLRAALTLMLVVYIWPISSFLIFPDRTLPCLSRKNQVGTAGITRLSHRV